LAPYLNSRFSHPIKPPPDFSAVRFVDVGRDVLCGADAPPELPVDVGRDVLCGADAPPELPVFT